MYVLLCSGPACADGPLFEALIPASLAVELQCSGIDTGALRPLELQKSPGAIYLFSTAAGDVRAVVTVHTGGRGMLLLDADSAFPGGTPALILFDNQCGTCRIIGPEAVSTDCFREILSTMKSVFFILYDCVLVADQRYCISSIIDLLIDLTITAIVCEPEPASDNGTAGFSAE